MTPSVAGEPTAAQVTGPQPPPLGVVPPARDAVVAAAEASPRPAAGPRALPEKNVVEQKHSAVETSRPKHRPDPPVHPHAQSGWLRVTTSDGAWAKATVGSDTLDIPGASFELKPGTATVIVTDGSVIRRCDVDFHPGTQTLTVSMKSGKCVVR
jgi:hypothetical protein